MRGEVGDDPKDEKFQKALQRIANEIAKETVFGRRRLEFFRSELPNYEAISEESPEL